MSVGRDASRSIGRPGPRAGDLDRPPAFAKSPRCEWSTDRIDREMILAVMTRPAPLQAHLGCGTVFLSFAPQHHVQGGSMVAKAAHTCHFSKESHCGGRSRVRRTHARTRLHHWLPLTAERIHADRAMTRSPGDSPPPWIGPRAASPVGTPGNSPTHPTKEGAS